jgi:hypothetical protein
MEVPVDGAADLVGAEPDACDDLRVHQPPASLRHLLHLGLLAQAVQERPAVLVAEQLVEAEVLVVLLLKQARASMLCGQQAEQRRSRQRGAAGGD